MICIEEVRSLMGDPAMSKEEAATLRAAAYELAAIIIAQWKVDVVQIATAGERRDHQTYRPK